MFYHNTKYKFALPDGSPANIAGGIIAASAMPAGQLIRRVRRDIRKYPYLQHRLFDPQMYLAVLDPAVARGPVVNLASYSWFGQNEIPEYDSKQHKSLKAWKAEHEQALVDAWPGAPLPDGIGREHGILAAVQHQLALGCEAIILPAPLTTVVAQNYQTETEWIDLGLQVCRDLRVAVPIYATVALSDTVLRGVDPRTHPLLHTITSQIAARDELNGAYLVIEQAGEDGYACSSRETLLSLLLMVDDLVRGASRQVIVNYMGTFGAIATAAGASVWSSGYYLSQRRLKLTDFDDKTAFAYPRYYSARLAGDIGLDADIVGAHSAGLARKILTDTATSEPLKRALEAESYPGAVPQWVHRPGNITAAAAHYNEVACQLGATLYALDVNRRVEYVERWLRGAVALVCQLNDAGIYKSNYTNLQHQAVWLSVYEDWRSMAGV